MGGGECMAGGMRGREGCAWQRGVWQRHAWQGDVHGRGVCVAGGIHSRGAYVAGGVCMARGINGRRGGMHGWGGGACHACPSGRYYEIQ